MMNSQAYHFNFCVELIIANNRIMILQSFHCNRCAIRQMTLVNYSISPLSQNISYIEVISGLSDLLKLVVL